MPFGLSVGAIGPTVEAATGSAAAWQDPVGSAPRIERFGIGWTFAAPVVAGTYANGDWWVVGPVDIVAISPGCRVADDRTRNGSMIDPDPRLLAQGYDSAILGDGGTSTYQPGLNVGLQVGKATPLRLVAGQSLVSSVSHPVAGHATQLETCAVLTCVAAPPPAGSFRPAYCAGDDTWTWNAERLDLSRLQRLPVPDEAPDPRVLAQRFERTWLDHGGVWSARALHPRQNMPDAGRDLADLVGQAALSLQLDWPEEWKRPLVVHLLQVGIDLHGIVAAGGSFPAVGGDGAGRKFPILFAGAVLHDDRILATLREHPLAFAEDVQTFYVAGSGRSINQGHGGYGPEDVGLAEWGHRHAVDPRSDNKPWIADPYRRCCTANAWHGFVLATRMMGLREAWAHPPLFDYVDRYMRIEAPGTWTRSWSPFAERMWDAHRSRF